MSSVAERPARNRRGAAHLPRAADRPEILPQDDIRVEHRDEPIEVALTRGRQKCVDNLTLRFEVRVGHGSLGAHAPARPTGELARRLRGAIDDRRDLVEGHGKDVVQHALRLRATQAHADSRRAFAFVVVVFARWRGLLSLVGLGISLVIVLLFVVPAILDGRSALLVAVVGSVAVAYTTIPLAHGWGPKSLAALLGSVASLMLTALLAVLFTNLTHLTGLSSEEAIFLQIGAANVSLQGLLLAGMVMGALGVLDDVTISQASTVMALRRADPAWRSVASPGSRSTWVEVVAKEVVATLVGSIGLIAAVPITTVLTALLALSVAPEQIDDDGHGHAH
jgi:hypothetical protein